MVCFIDGAWTVKEDHRGKIVFNKVTAEKHEAEDIGPIPDTHTEQSPEGLKNPIWNYGWKEAPITVEQVKTEAGRRILALMPEWKQRNYTARMTELLKIYAVSGTWTAKEQAEVGFLEGEWAKAKAIREASDTIEAMNPIPVDYTNDKYWP